jgi:ABC-type polysaccharide/polyol phosphate transport system ATPase subunit
LQRLAGFEPAKYFREFWALRGVHFCVKRGEAVGIIGRNGSGKSTLLQLICGTLAPTTGDIFATGRIGALLELGAGFDPEFTGRENVYLNGAILGLSHEEIYKKFDEIVAFADIGGFVDQPVKTYSSGMFIRLAFAVHAHTRPDILIVDEALSVGDIFFQQKCFQRMDFLLENGTTLLFVSHDLGAITKLCERTLFLRNGTLEFDGPTQEAVNRYYRSSVPARSGSTRLDLAPMNGDQSLLLPKEKVRTVLTHSLHTKATSRHGTKTLEIMAVTVLDADGNVRLSYEIGEVMRVAMLIRANGDVPRPQAGINLYDRFGNLVFAGGNHNLGVEIGPFWQGDERLYEFEVTLDVQQGVYTYSAIVSEQSADGPNAGMFYDVLEGLGPIEVSFDPGNVMPFYGVARLPTRVAGCWRVTLGTSN